MAHLGYFRQEYVVARRWIDERVFGDLVSLCQFLPGPASSQLGIAIGMTRGGILGGVAAWLGFTLPSAAALMLFAYGVTHLEAGAADGALRGLKAVAVAVVAIALWGMSKSLAPDRERATIAAVCAIILTLWRPALAHVGVIAAAGAIGWLMLRDRAAPIRSHTGAARVGKRVGAASLALFAVALFGLPLAARLISHDWISLFDGFFRSGSLVFGGGHVILPLLQAEAASYGWVTDDQFIAGYGAAQAAPGPLLAFSAYVGTLYGGWSAGIVALAAVFLPSFLLVAGALPFWHGMLSNANLRAAMLGVNAGVVGLLGAALYDPMWTTAVTGARDLALVIAAFALLAYWKWPPWLVVLLGAAAGAGMELLPA